MSNSLIEAIRSRLLDKKKKGIKFFMKGGKKDSNSGDEASDHESMLIFIYLVKKNYLFYY